MSIYYQLLTAVTKSIKTIFDNTIIRIKPLVFEKDTLPICIVSAGSQGEMVKYEAFNRVLIYRYPVLVSYIDAENRLMTEGLEDYFDNRELIRNQIYQVPSILKTACVFDIKFLPNEAVEFASFLKTSYKCTGWQVYYDSTETRKS